LRIETATDGEAADARQYLEGKAIALPAKSFYKKKCLRRDVGKVNEDARQSLRSDVGKVQSEAGNN